MHWSEDKNDEHQETKILLFAGNAAPQEEEHNLMTSLDKDVAGDSCILHLMVDESNTLPSHHQISLNISLPHLHMHY